MDMSLGKYNDKELITLLKGEKRDAELAFAEIYSRYAQRVYAYCFRVTGDVEDARDIFQETFTKFFHSSQKPHSIDNISAFLVSIARNLCLNYKRDKKREVVFDDYYMNYHDQGYEQQELLEIIARALELLDFEHREAFVLRQYHGMPYKDISELTGENISTIKNRVWRAKEKIKEILEPILEDLSK